MQQAYSWSWIQSQVLQTIEVWDHSAERTPRAAPQYSPQEQTRREQAYDKALREVDREGKAPTPPTRAARIAKQDRMTASFARFSAEALDLKGDAVQLLTGDFLPVGTRLARWARRFDSSLTMPDIIQACRNAWTACGLQPLMGEPIGLTPSILGYSMLYPYTDNFLDQADISAATKHHFSARFRERLSGLAISPENRHECALWELVGLVEGQYPRTLYPGVFDCMLAIHRAQEESLAQLRSEPRPDEVLRMSCAKGGSSVLADACLARGWLSQQESQFGFEWGVLLQLGDDLQDVREDLLRGSTTLFSRTATAGTPLDSLAAQLLSFSDAVADRMDALPHGNPMLKELLRMSWRSLIVGGIADSHQFFTPGFLAGMERTSPFRFAFLRARRELLASREGLYTTLFHAFLEHPEDDDTGTPLPAPALAVSGCA
jgi:hypothetical protein